VARIGNQKRSPASTGEQDAAVVWALIFIRPAVAGSTVAAGVMGAGCVVSEPLLAA
jgi:hypothetical protein